MGKPMSAAQRAALKKAQIASARKRRGKGKAKPAGGAKSHFQKHKKKYLVAGATVAVVGAAYASKKGYNKARSNKIEKIKSDGRKRLAAKQASREKQRRVEANIKSHFDSMAKKHSAKVSGIKSDALSKADKARKRQLRNEKYARQSQKAADRGLYDAGLPVSSGKKIHALSSGKKKKTSMTAQERHRMADRARRKRGLGGYIPSKAKHNRRRSKTARKKYPRV